MPLPVMQSDFSKSSNRGRLFAWLQLMRLANVFTAVADVAMGYLVTHRNLEPPAHFALLVVVSCLLYLSGMVLNDVFDADVDAREQPTRPIPSGRITQRSAAAVGWAMLASGVLPVRWQQYSPRASCFTTAC
jgi:4-hydroxybenzoate polyprenyltransferase